MSEKKVLKMDDEAMLNVSGGQGYNADCNVNVNYDDPNAPRLVCPECGEDLGTMLHWGDSFGGVCPHCKKNFTINS